MFSSIAICTCKCEDCDVEIFRNLYVHNRHKYITAESIKKDEFMYLNGHQIFDQNFLIDFEQQLVQNTVSFEGYTSAYNFKIHVIEHRENKQVFSTSKNNSVK